MLDTATFIHTWLIPCLAVVLAGCGVVVTAKLNGWMNVHAAWLTADQKAKVVSLENAAYNRAVDWLLNTVQVQGGKIQIHPESWMMKTAVQMVLDHPAGVLGKPQDIANQIVAMLPMDSLAQASPQVTVPPISTASTQPTGDLNVSPRN